MGEAALHCMLGLGCHEFSMIAADQMTVQSIIVMQNDVDKLYTVADKLLMGVTGDQGDAMQLSQFISKNIDLYRFKNGYNPSMEAIVHFTRKNMADCWKTTPYKVNMLIAGYDDEKGGLLYYMDPICACLPVPIAAHGFGGLFALTILQHYHRPNMSEAEAYETIQLCVREIHHRLFLNLPNFIVKVVNKNGICTLPNVCPQTFMG